MNNYTEPTKDIIEKISLTKDIQERRQIIDRYKQTGYLDRDDAIKKIRELRCTDDKVVTVTIARLAVSSTPFDRSSNEQIVGELQMQVTVLEAELAEKESNPNG